MLPARLRMRDLLLAYETDWLPVSHEKLHERQLTIQRRYGTIPVTAANTSLCILSVVCAHPV